MTPFPMVIDIAHGDEGSLPNGKIDFKAAYAAGVRGIIHKASEGASYVDPLYAERREECHEQTPDMLFGAYHFGTAEDTSLQMNNFMKSAAPDADTLMAIDYEDNSADKYKRGTMRYLQLINVIDMLERSTLAIKPWVYSGNLLRETIGDSITLRGVKLWFCEYGPEPKLLPKLWQGKQYLWQYTGDGVGPQPHQVAGFKGNLDCNHFFGTEAELRAMWSR